MLNGAAPSQQTVGLPVNGQVLVPGPAIPAQVFASPASEPVGNPSECLLLKNMFDPASEVCNLFSLFVSPLVIPFGRGFKSQSYIAGGAGF